MTQPRHRVRRLETNALAVVGRSHTRGEGLSPERFKQTDRYEKHYHRQPPKGQIVSIQPNPQQPTQTTTQEVPMACNNIAARLERRAMIVRYDNCLKRAHTARRASTKQHWLNKARTIKRAIGLEIV